MIMMETEGRAWSEVHFSRLQDIHCKRTGLEAEMLNINPLDCL